MTTYIVVIRNNYMFIQLKYTTFYILRRTFILILDSLGGGISNRKTEIRNLNKYLRCEYRDKIDKNIKLSKHQISSACPKVPQQHNGTDCGLFMLEYIERFLLVKIIFIMHINIYN